MSDVNRTDGTDRPARLSRGEQQARTRAALVAAAAAVFAERGFAGASVEEIVARAGYTRGAFYSNFADKEALLLAVFDERDRQDVVEVSALVGAAASMEDVVALLRSSREEEPDARTWRILLTEFRLHALRHPSLRSRLAAREQRQRAAYRDALEHMFAVSGVAVPGDPELMALVLQVLDDGIALHRDLEPDAVPRQTFLDALDLLARSAMALARQEPPEDRRGSG